MKQVLRKHPKLGNSENGHSLLYLLTFSRLKGAFITYVITGRQTDSLQHLQNRQLIGKHKCSFTACIFRFPRNNMKA